MISKNPTCIVNWQTSMALPRNRSATFAPFSTTSATSVSTGSSMPVSRPRPVGTVVRLRNPQRHQYPQARHRQRRCAHHFEYIVGIVWYKVSNRKGRILDYFNLSLDADLLPKTHAAGGMEDITYRYNATPGYPEHTLLIEATLAEANAQRRMEMEPVSRHLGDFLLRDNRQEAYALFVTPFLHLNVISDFRGRKHLQYLLQNPI